MKKRFLVLILVLILLIIINPVYSESDSSKFWVLFKLNQNANVENVINYQLLSQDMSGVGSVNYQGGPKNSFRDLGINLNHGWSVVYYDGNEPIVQRSPYSAYSDQPFPTETDVDSPHLLCINNNTECNFRNYIHFILAKVNPNIATVHIRKATSGVIPETGNPQNFIRRADNAEYFTFGHIGTIDKAILLDLIDPFYLNHFKIEYGSKSDINSLIDSELLFVYILQEIQEERYDVETALKKVIINIASHDSKYSFGDLSFYLTNGQKLWVFNSYKIGSNSISNLYYKQTDDYITISSDILNSDKSWVSLPDYSLVTIDIKNKMNYDKIKSIKVIGSVVNSEKESLSNAKIVLISAIGNKYTTYSDEFGKFNFNNINETIFLTEKTKLIVSHKDFPETELILDSDDQDYFEIELKEKNIGVFKFIMGSIFAIIIIMFFMKG